MSLIQRTIDAIKGKAPFSAKRSKQWPKVRDAYLVKHPRCKVCGGTVKVVVHHKKPFYLFPELELVESNLISICESKKYGVNCHLFIGHLGNFKSYNENVYKDAILWKSKLACRPKG